MVDNDIGDLGARIMVELLYHNSTLQVLTLDGNAISPDITNEVDIMIEWNRSGGVTHAGVLALDHPYQEYFIFLLVLLTDLPICDDLHWIILEMLTLKDTFTVLRRTN